jgi:hypothetical protein
VVTVKGMTRRHSGVVILILALIVVMVVPMVNGRRVAGSPIAIDFPAPPAVGDCVRPPLPEATANNRTRGQIAVTAVRFGPCTGYVAGEVVSVGDANSIATAPDSPYSRDRCSSDIAAYAGLQTSRRPDTIREGSNSSIQWTPTFAGESLLIVPSSAERNAGQRWVACLAVPVVQQPYQGSLRGGYTTGLPDQFGLCWTAVDLSLKAALIPCSESHPAELLATGWIASRSALSIDEITASCVEVAAEVMKTPDPTHDGKVRVVLDAVRQGWAATPDAPLTVGCLLTSSDTHQLTGTVIGLGDRPVPLTK